MRNAKLSAEPFDKVSSNSAGSTPLLLATATASASALTLEQHHVVEDLCHLSGADATAVGDVGGEAPDQRLDRGVQFRRRADHDAQRPVLRGLTRTGDRRIDPGRALGLQLRREIAGLSDRGSPEIDHDLALADILENAVALEHRTHVFGAGKAQEQDFAVADDVSH